MAVAWVGIGAVESYAGSLAYISTETFTALVADPVIPGTVMNIIAALGNVSKEWSSTLALYLSDKDS